MIKRLEIEGLESHKHTVLEFSPCLNIIKGTSDTGKTAVANAIDFVFYNGLRGTSFINYDCEHARVTMTLFNGIVIVRHKSTTENYYLITKPGQKTEPYRNIKDGVPKEILDLGIKLFNLDVDHDVNPNIVSQFETPFIILASSAVKLKFLSRLGFAHYIEIIIRNFQKYVKNSNAQKAFYESEIKTMSVQLEKNKNIEELYEQCQKYLKEYDAIGSDINEINYLKEMHQKLTEIKKSYGIKKNKVAQIESLNLKELEDETIVLCELAAINNKLISIKIEHTGLKVKADKIDNELKRYNDLYKDELLKTGKCPICGNAVTEDTINKCLTELI